MLKRDCVRFLKCVGASSFPRRSTSRPRRKCNADSRGGVGAALALEIRLDDCHHQQIHVAHLHNSLKSLVVENSAWNYGTELSDPDAICFIRMKTSPCTQISRSGPSLGTRACHDLAIPHTHFRHHSHKPQNSLYNSHCHSRIETGTTSLTVAFRPAC